MFLSKQDDTISRNQAKKENSPLKHKKDSTETILHTNMTYLY